MIENQEKKVYGLSFPTRKTNDNVKQRIESVFNVDSDDEEGTAPLKLPRVTSGLSTTHQAKIHRKTKSDYEKALEEDPSVFQYDEIYDTIRSEKDLQLGSAQQGTKKQPKYVDRLLRTANERKLERELCSERKAQKEIEAESDLYGDKEAFVTSAYKDKLSQLRELVVQREEEQMREKLMDVTTQDGLGGFYRYMYQHGMETASEKESISGAVSSEKKDKVPSTNVAELHSCDERVTPTSQPPPKTYAILRASEEGRTTTDAKLGSSNKTESSKSHADSRSERTEHKKCRSPEHPQRKLERSHSHRKTSESRDHKYRPPIEQAGSSHHTTGSQNRVAPDPRQETSRAPEHRRARSPLSKSSRASNEEISDHIRRSNDHRSNNQYRSGDKDKQTEHATVTGASTPTEKRSGATFSKNPDQRTPTDPNWIYARPRVTTDEQIAEARQRFLDRKAAGLTCPVIADSDSE
ncbi:Nuclear speckle splicing regulatory protein [Paragonimus heterotremus]|uniref:Nuclear speckle splicing regulatory protein n=1 Tax=Paragonimus heterotremus TaxID=100268 RepID=A0A8J4SNK3_9TREM|nr:Nuclear speckle splicing regulatory protein [Paragonimus heterotremus]